MPYYRFLALPVLFASSFTANAEDNQATLSHCAKAALSGRVTEQTAVTFERKLSQVSAPRSKYSMSNQTVAIEVEDGNGQPLGVVTCKYGRTGKMVSATLVSKMIDVAGI